MSGPPDSLARARAGSRRHAARARTTRERSRAFLSILLASAASTVSCVTVGKPFDTKRADNVREGQSRSDVVRAFGEPSAGNKLSLVDDPSACVKRYRYGFADGTGAYVLWVDFDADDRVCRTIFTSG